MCVCVCVCVCVGRGACSYSCSCRADDAVLVGHPSCLSVCLRLTKAAQELYSTEQG